MEEIRRIGKPLRVMNGTDMNAPPAPTSAETNPMPRPAAACTSGDGGAPAATSCRSSSMRVAE